MHIAIAGNIGCGKTTLTNMLAKHYGWTPRFESVDFNPYLEDFYADMSRWSLTSRYTSSISAFRISLISPNRKSGLSRTVQSMRTPVSLPPIYMSRDICRTGILITTLTSLT